jgi:hypothetical protein
MILRFHLTLAVVPLLLASLVGPTTSAADDTPRYVWDDVPRIVAVGDVHGALDPLLSVLEGAGLVDADLAWSGGDTHLVFVGDLIDRGPDDRAVLDLVMRLQKKAPAVGGRVHVLVGNHEVMNVVRDLRYVSDEGFEGFVDEEYPPDRRAAWERFKSTVSREELGLRAFNERYPPGFFGRLRAFAPDGQYGSWIRELPVAIRINGYLFVHGGLRPEVASLGLGQLNARFRDELYAFFDHAAVLDGTVVGVPTYSELFTLATARAERSSKSDATPEAVAARGFLATVESLPFAPGGPIWYRGDALENERLERRPLARALSALDARAMVVGHTPTRLGVITSRFGGKVYRTDVGAVYRDRSSALVIENDRVTVFDPLLVARIDPLRESGLGEGFPPDGSQLPDPVLEKFLERAKIVGRGEIAIADGRRFQVVELKGKGLHLRGVFGSAMESIPEGTPREKARPRRYKHEIAAYRLDRLLGLGFVPVTVERKVGKKEGALQVFLEDAVDLPYLREHGRLDLVDGLEPEIRKAVVFSALVGTRDRIDAAKMLLPLERRLMLADHTIGFTLNTEVDELLDRPVQVQDVGPCSPMDPSLEVALGALTEKQLRAELGDYLSKEQIDALLARRDGILQRCGTAGKDRVD